jgi:hypothetical protein
MEDSTIWSLPKRCRKVFPDCDRWYLLHMSTFSISSFGCTNLPNVDSTYSRGFVSNNYRILWISFFFKWIIINIYQPIYMYIQQIMVHQPISMTWFYRFSTKYSSIHGNQRVASWFQPDQSFVYPRVSRCLPIWF